MFEEVLARGGFVKILFFTDCMSIGPDYLDDSKYYPQIIKSYFESNQDENVTIKIISGSGETTIEALEKLKAISTLNEKFDAIVFAYGINDALPRGLQRTTRSTIIRNMFKLKFNESIRLFARTFFLNPLEFINQIISTPKFYVTSEQYVNNIIYILNELNKLTNGKIIYISINPILNYRFINGNYFLKNYNDKLKSALSDSKYFFVNLFEMFSSDNYKEYLANDKFHYSELAHKLVAESITKILESETSTKI